MVIYVHTNGHYMFHGPLRVRVRLPGYDTGHGAGVEEPGARRLSVEQGRLMALDSRTGGSTSSAMFVVYADSSTARGCRGELRNVYEFDIIGYRDETQVDT